MNAKSYFNRRNLGSGPKIIRNFDLKTHNGHIFFGFAEKTHIFFRFRRKYPHFFSASTKRRIFFSASPKTNIQKTHTFFFRLKKRILFVCVYSFMHAKSYTGRHSELEPPKNRIRLHSIGLNCLNSEIESKLIYSRKQNPCGFRLDFQEKRISKSKQKIISKQQKIRNSSESEHTLCASLRRAPKYPVCRISHFPREEQENCFGIYEIG